MSNNFFKINKGVNLTPQSSAPSSPSNGDMYYDSTRGTFVKYINGAWQDSQSRSDVASAASLTSTDITSSKTQSSIIKITGSTVSDIHGLAAQPDSKVVVLYNNTSVTVTIKHQSGTEGTAANRVVTKSAADVSVTTGSSVVFIYDSAQSRWVLMQEPQQTALSPTMSVRSVTTTDTATTADDILVFSGSSFSETIFTAVGNSGKIIELQHNGTDNSATQNRYTLLTTGGQTIGGLASGAIKMCTPGETYRLVSDGANFIILEHRTGTEFADFFSSSPAASIMIGSTTNPTYGTVATSYFKYLRRGRMCDFIAHVRTTTAGTAGSGDYSFDLPAQLQIDTGFLIMNSTVYGASYPSNFSSFGWFQGIFAGTYVRGIVYAASADRLKVAVPAVGVFGSGTSSMANSIVEFQMHGSFPVLDWRP